MIVVRVDNEKRIIHFEFQIDMSDYIGTRTFDYDFKHMEKLGIRGNTEYLRLPISAIVRPKMDRELKDSERVRFVDMEVGKQRIKIEFPVVSAMEVFPELRDIAKCGQDVERFRDGVYRFAEKVPGLNTDKAEFTDLARILTLITEDKSYSSVGISDREVDNMVKYVSFQGKTMSQIRKICVDAYQIEGAVKCLFKLCNGDLNATLAQVETTMGNISEDVLSVVLSDLEDEGFDVSSLEDSYELEVEEVEPEDEESQEDDTDSGFSSGGTLHGMNLGSK